MMEKPAAHTRSWETAETILVIGLVLGWVLGYFVPLRLSMWLPRAVSLGAGAVVLFTALTVISATRRQFRQAGQPTDPGQPTTRLITTGIFAWSRNPLYLAGLLFFLGLGVLLDSLWLVLFLAPVMAAMQVLLILPEEHYLEAKFGEAYRQYRGTVRRWFGRSR